MGIVHNHMKKALITGIFGQDGYYLSKLLVEKGYEVFGFCPQNMLPRTKEDHLNDITIMSGSVAEQQDIEAAIAETMPDELYNLAAPSFVPASWDDPITTVQVAGIGIVRILDAVRKIKSDVRVYQASSSELFGNADVSPQNERTPFRPANPYAAAKLYAHTIVTVYRQRYKLFACSGILFNHESPRRPAEYITRKVTRGAAKIKMGLAKELRLGNLDARRDWGYAGDYVRAMWLMLQQSKPDDFVIGTGTPHTVRDLVEICFNYLGLNWKDFVVTDPTFYRPAEEIDLVADSSKARERLGWRPEVSFEELLHMMIENDLKILRQSASR
jgi:GDPmannose 4,6-dehydratase